MHPEAQRNIAAYETLARAMGGCGVATFEVELMLKAVDDWQALWTLQHSMTAQLDKENGKEKCQGVRLINMLCPTGKLFFNQVQGYTQEKAYDFAYGYYKHKRREQALLVDQAVAWRLGEMARKVPQREAGRSVLRHQNVVAIQMPAGASVVMSGRTLPGLKTVPIAVFIVHIL